MASVFGNIRGEFLNMDLTEFGKLARFFQQVPALLPKATAQLLNDLGFAWRPLAVTTLASRLTMRSPAFILSRMQVQKTTAGPIARQVVTVGSTFVRGKGGKLTFDGFYSLQTGYDPERNRTMALLARGGERRSVVQKGSRLNQPDIPTTDESPVQSGSEVQALIRDMARNAPNKPFIIKRGMGFAPGLYRIAQGKGYLLPSGRSAPKIQIVQHFGRLPKSSRWTWINDSVMRLLTHAPMLTMWNVAISKVVAEAQRRAELKASGA